MTDEPTTDLVPQEIDYQKLIAQAKDLPELISALIEPEVAKADKKRISSRQAKIESWFGKQEDLPAEQVTDLRIRMMNFVDQLFAKVHVDEARELTADEAVALMQEFLDAEDFKITFTARREATKRMVFNHLTAENIRKHVSEPDNHNGWLEVPELHKKFCREGTGRHEPILSENLLKDFLGEEDWNKVIDVEVIPEQTVETINDEKLMALARKNPKVLEKVREALVLGEVKNPKFQVRNI
jgi:hypothetical protein